MQDLLLWQYLRQPTLPSSAQLVRLLEELSCFPLGWRSAYLGVLDRVLNHDDADVRAAGLKVLAGAQGLPAWQALLAGLKDPVLSVRRAAVEALRQSAMTDPGRWVHALFHADPEVRLLAQELAAPPGFASLFPPAAPFPGHQEPSLPTPAGVPFCFPASAKELKETQKILAESNLSQDQQNKLENFLLRGTAEEPGLRLQIAEHLSRFGHPEVGLPLLLQGISRELLYLDFEQLEIVARATVYLGSADLEKSLMDVLYDRDWMPEDEKVLLIFLTQSVGLDIRYWARDWLRATTAQALYLARLARTFAWGVEMGKYLTGQRFKIEMLLTDQDLGYTRLRENKLHINPLPILRGERGGSKVVQGLILHEYGHHLFHKGEEAETVWKQAEEQGLGRLLNLVADEHLERNLRQRSPRYGDLLKILNAYAFLYSQRQVAVASLLHYLGPYCWAVLPHVSLAAARNPGHVVVRGGLLLRHMEAAGHSFARFFRALRLGLGNRSGDLRVAQALALFKSNFRKSSMPQLLDIARRLREIFGAEADMLNHFAMEQALAGDEGEWLGTGPAPTREAVQKAVDNLLNGPAAQKGGGRQGGNCPASWGLDLRPEETFQTIDNVVKLAHDPALHGEYARRVARPARRLRRYFQDLGLGLRPQRARLQGRVFDRTRTRALVLGGDPRLLIARQMERATDLFLGVAIDCSGSMTGDKLEKAKLFGTMLAEALKGQPGIDLRLLGFTERAIFDAGEARFCAVHALMAQAGNNDAAALWHAFHLARASRRQAKLLVMISDGLPTECTVSALKGLVARLTRWHYCCAQVAVQPIEHICFPHYVLLEDQELDSSVRKFGEVVMRLVGKALGIG